MRRFDLAFNTLEVIRRSLWMWSCKLLNAMKLRRYVIKMWRQGKAEIRPPAWRISSRSEEEIDEKSGVRPRFLRCHFMGVPQRGDVHDEENA